MVRACIAALAVTLLGAVGAPAGTRTAALVAESLDDEDSQCEFVLYLCERTNDAIERAAGTPATADVTVFKHDAEVALRLEEIADAVRVIRKKHGGKRLACFKDPECEGLIDP